MVRSWLPSSSLIAPEEAKNALNMLQPDTLDTAAAPMGNLKVMPTDILPLALCDQDWVKEMGEVIMADGRPYLTIYQHDQLVCALGAPRVRSAPSTAPQTGPAAVE